jgi:carbonic anhydrase
MEAHLVHRNTDSGNLAVLGVMLHPGGLAANPAVTNALEFAPKVRSTTMKATSGAEQRE